MKNLFPAIFKNHNKNIPLPVIKCLKANFPSAINIEWEQKENKFEAVFYLNEVEHIAQISDNGQLIEYKKNLWINDLPELLKTEAAKIGEIMNAIVIFRNKNEFFEIIIRNKDFSRKLLIFDQNGNLLKTTEI